MGLFAVSAASKIGFLELPLFDSYILIVGSIVIFLIGFYSPKHGFSGLKNDRGSIEDSTPGMGIRKSGPFGDGPSDGGGGGGGD